MKRMMEFPFSSLPCCSLMLIYANSFFRAVSSVNPEQKGGDQWFLINMLTVLQNHSEKGVNRFTSPASGEVFKFPPTSGFHPD